MPAKVVRDFYYDFMWTKFNETGKDIVLHWSSGKEYIIKPGERLILPKQIELLHAASDPKNEVVFYGGALGGAKSYGCRAVLLERLINFGKRRGKGMVDDKPPVAAIFCEDYPALKSRHVDDIQNWPSWLGRYYKSEKEFRLNDNFGGGILKLLNLDKPAKYASAQFAAAFIDELTFNDESTFEAIDSRVRWPGIPDTIIIAASNPGRKGHSWVRKRFVETKTRQPGVAFISSLLRDNPFLDLDPKYRKKLERYPPKIRKAWLEGSWEVFEGQYFPDLNPEVHLVSPRRIPDEWTRYRVIDWGFKHPCACIWGAVDPKGNLWIYRTYEALETTSEVVKQHIHELSVNPYTGAQERYEATFGDPACKRQDGSALGNKTPYETFNNPMDGIGSFDVVEAMRDRVEGWQALQQALHYEIDSDESEKQETAVFKTYPKIRIFNDLTHISYLGTRSTYSGNALWEELNNLVYDEKKDIEDAFKNKGYYDIGEGDDAAECLRYLWAMAGTTDLSQIKQERVNDAILRSDFSASQFHSMSLDDFTQPRNPYIPN